MCIPECNMPNAQIKLRFYRQRRGLTAAELSKRSGVDKATISRIENAGRPGKRRTSIGASYPAILRLAAALGITPDELAPVDLPGLPTPIADTGGDEP
jgi:transcriptional regulator with XRE-family HTH domain